MKASDGGWQEAHLSLGAWAAPMSSLLVHFATWKGLVTFMQVDKRKCCQGILGGSTFGRFFFPLVSLASHFLNCFLFFQY